MSAESGAAEQVPLHRFSEIESPWDWPALLAASSQPSACNICGWSGESFAGVPHSESGHCPGCQSIARDRFLFYCFVHSTPRGRHRVLETSPRLGEDYRQAMRRWFDYHASDFDQRAHRAELNVDLQNMNLESDSLDVVLCPHVLEHVPRPDDAFAELHRVLAPGGRLFMQVPIEQGWTTPPTVPEFHGDHTPVFWHYGLDLTDRLRRHGFRTRILCNWGFYRQVAAGANHWPDPVPHSIDIRSLLEACSLADLVPVADEELTRRLWVYPGYMFLTWEAVKGAPARARAESPSA
jgi:SAM-dependent methyltransferase